MYIESNILELKETLNDKLVKEIVAFLNTEGGKIYIGIKDDGTIVGVEEFKLDEYFKKIADVISTQIEPAPNECVKTNFLLIEKKRVILIEVIAGNEPLYCIKKHGYSPVGCQIRVGTTCREMPQEQIDRRYKSRFRNSDLITETATNLTELTFSTLKTIYADKGYTLNDNTFKQNLYLIKEDGKYNVLAELLSEQNRYSFIFVKFKGLDKSSISGRNDYGMKSLIFAYEQLINRIQSENVCISDTSIRPRKDIYLYDFNAVNEAIVNAVAHNDWLISEPQVSMYSDRLEILSHGGLNPELSINDFFNGVSRPKNVKLMKILSDLDIVDHTGHGIPIIVNKYGKEAIEITENHILVTIPFNKEVMNSFSSTLSSESNVSYNDLKHIEKDILSIISDNPYSNALTISQELNKSKKTIERYFIILQEKGYIKRVGSKSSGHWRIIK